MKAAGSDRTVRGAKTISQPDQVTAIVDAAIKPEQADTTIAPHHGCSLHKFIERAAGSVVVRMAALSMDT